MSPFMLKHIKSYMKTNAEMLGVAQLAAGNKRPSQSASARVKRQKALLAKAAARERLEKLKA